jgi:hypothetical protein
MGRPEIALSKTEYGRRQFAVIPKRAFENAADRQAFDALLVAHVPKVERRA